MRGKIVGTIFLHLLDNFRATALIYMHYLSQSKSIALNLSYQGGMARLFTNQVLMKISETEIDESVCPFQRAELIEKFASHTKSVHTRF